MNRILHDATDNHRCRAVYGQPTLSRKHENPGSARVFVRQRSDGGDEGGAVAEEALVDGDARAGVGDLAAVGLAA